MPSSNVERYESSADPVTQDVTVKPDLIEATQPVSHPPVPSRNSVNDYLAKRGNNLADEENPFDSQFGGGPAPKSTATKTPGGTLLPSIHALQSGVGSIPGFMGGLRQGPLSPSMLAGPKEPAADYFSGEHGMGISDAPRGFVTPNESALRHQTSASSPGGNSMFRSALSMQGLSSPGMFTNLPTPGAAEFVRTAEAIREQRHSSNHVQTRDSNITSQPHQMLDDNNNGLHSEYVEDNQSNAAASLFMLANSASSRDTSPYYSGSVPLSQSRQPSSSTQTQILNRNHQMLNQQMNQHMTSAPSNNQLAGRPNHPPTMNGHSMDPRARNESIDSNMSSPVSNGHNMGYENEMNGQGPQSSGKKRGSNKRKTTPSKTSPKGAKRPKGSSAVHKKSDETKAEGFTNEDLDDMDDQNQAEIEEHEETNDKGKPKKPETEDEKRKSFLERNRVAALKCRQRKKQWLNNLQSKVDSYTTENEMLQQKVQSMHNEIVQLKTMLLAHKDSPVGIQQGIASFIMGPGSMYEEQHMHAQNPYGLAAMAPPQPGMQ